MHLPKMISNVFDKTNKIVRFTFVSQAVRAILYNAFELRIKVKSSEIKTI